MKKIEEKIDLTYWAKTCPVSYILIHAVGLWAVTQVVYWLLFIKLGF